MHGSIMPLERHFQIRIIAEGEDSITTTRFSIRSLQGNGANPFISDELATMQKKSDLIE